MEASSWKLEAGSKGPGRGAPTADRATGRQGADKKRTVPWKLTVQAGWLLLQVGDLVETSWSKHETLSTRLHQLVVDL